MMTRHQNRYSHITMGSVLILTFLLGAQVSNTASEESPPRVTTRLGPIEGSYRTSFGGRQYEAYEGIPYAQAPIGDLRFEIAKTISPWTDTLMAKEPGSACLQYNYGLADPAANKLSGSEDCLYMNIYTPVARKNCKKANGTADHLLPVIFFIHGGAFLIGEGRLYQPTYLLDRDVVMVSFNYRLGPLGFLNTEDSTVPGNMGLKDQVIALRWVNENIESFGGNPSRITLTGQSAGGASVHYQYLTKLTAGLFQRGISVSGTALNPWTQTRNPLEKAKKLSTVVGCSTNDVQSMVDCLKSLPADQIVNALSEFTELPYHFNNRFGPSVEKGGGDFTFIDREPMEIIAAGDAHDVPWLTSMLSEEALYPLGSYLGGDQTPLFERLNDDWEELASYVLFYEDTIEKNRQANVARTIKEHYLGKEPISRATFKEIVRMFSNRMFLRDWEKAAKAQAQLSRSPVHAYYFSYRGAHSYTEAMTGNNENIGVCHLDDLSYILQFFFDPTTTARDRDIQKLLIDIWVSYATDGTLNVGTEWPTLTATADDEFQYLHIAGPEDIGMETASNIGDSEFWDSLGFEENTL